MRERGFRQINKVAQCHLVVGVVPHHPCPLFPARWRTGGLGTVCPSGGENLTEPPVWLSCLCFLVLSLLCLVAQSCPTFCDPMDCSPPGSSVHGDSPDKNTGVGCHVLQWGKRDWLAWWQTAPSLQPLPLLPRFLSPPVPPPTKPSFLLEGLGACDSRGGEDCSRSGVYWGSVESLKEGSLEWHRVAGKC